MTLAPLTHDDESQLRNAIKRTDPTIEDVVFDGLDVWIIRAEDNTRYTLDPRTIARCPSGHIIPQSYTLIPPDEKGVAAN